MPQVRKSIFRDRALQQYMQKQEREIFPRVAWPPIGILYGIVLGLLLIAGYLAWHKEIPAYITGSGVILEHDERARVERSETLALVFLPASSHPRMHVGLPIRLWTDLGSLSITGRIEKIEPGIIRPLEASIRYHLGQSGAQIVSQPSIVLLVRASPLFRSHASAGNLIHAQLQNGSQSLLSLLAGL